LERHCRLDGFNYQFIDTIHLQLLAFDGLGALAARAA
jgi:hypothetical protein